MDIAFCLGLFFLPPPKGTTPGMRGRAPVGTRVSPCSARKEKKRKISCMSAGGMRLGYTTAPTAAGVPCEKEARGESRRDPGSWCRTRFHQKRKSSSPIYAQHRNKGRPTSWWAKKRTEGRPLLGRASPKKARVRNTCARPLLSGSGGPCQRENSALASRRKRSHLFFPTTTSY